MIKKPSIFVLKFFAVFAFLLPCAAAPTHPAAQAQPSQDPQKTNMFVPRPRLVGQRGAAEKAQLPGDGNLPEAASALPLISAIGAGALLGGLLSARRTHRDKSK
jgi:hypothetical protein